MSGPGGNVSADALFAALVDGAVAKGWDSPEGTELLAVLPALVRPLVGQFPGLEPEEILSCAWEIASRPGLSGKQHPRTWLVKGVRRELLLLVQAQRDLVDVSTVKSRGWREARDALGVLADKSLVLTGPAAEEFLSGVRAAPVSVPDGAGVWEDLYRLLVRLRWPHGLARAAVEVLEGRANRGAVAVDGTARDLGFLGKGYREPLARFAFAKPGFVWARLHGVSWGGALAVARKAGGMEALVWKPSRPVRDTRTVSGSAGTVSLRLGRCAS